MDGILGFECFGLLARGGCGSGRCSRAAALLELAAAATRAGLVAPDARGFFFKRLVRWNPILDVGVFLLGFAPPSRFPRWVIIETVELVTLPPPFLPVVFANEINGPR